jgi:hypothetical protein
LRRVDSDRNRVGIGGDHNCADADADIVRRKLRNGPDRGFVRMLRCLKADSDHQDELSTTPGTRATEFAAADLTDPATTMAIRITGGREPPGVEGVMADRDGCVAGDSPAGLVSSVAAAGVAIQLIAAIPAATRCNIGWG